MPVEDAPFGERPQVASLSAAGPLSAGSRTQGPRTRALGCRALGARALVARESWARENLGRENLGARILGASFWVAQRFSAAISICKRERLQPPRYFRTEQSCSHLQPLRNFIHQKSRIR